MGYGQKVFHLPNLWPTKDSYVFMVKNLTVIANQKKSWRVICFTTISSINLQNIKVIKLTIFYFEFRSDTRTTKCMLKQNIFTL